MTLGANLIAQRCKVTGKMNHLTACRAQAAICREKAESDVVRRDYWLGEARKWEKRAEDEANDSAVAYQINRHVVPKAD